jgi:peptidoglycan/LPS O-acetylase OafA/YrhL
VLSGFLITGILVDMPKDGFRRYILAFYERRVRRILPPYLLLLVVCSAVFGTAWMVRWYLYLGLMNYLPVFIHDPEYPAFMPLWSLAVEEQFYVIWPLVVYYVSAKRLPKVLIAVIVLTPIIRGVGTILVANQVWDQYHWFIFKGTPFRCDCLAMGGLLMFVWRRYGEKIKAYGYLGLIVTALAPVVMLLLSRYWSGFSTMDGTIRGNVVTYEVSLAAVTGAFVWALGGRFTGVLTITPMRWLGRISYSFYLIHQAALLLFERWFHGTGVIALFAASASLVYATLSWYLMEAPILHGGSRARARRELKAAEPQVTATATDVH